MGKNEPMESSEKKKICTSGFLMIFHLDQHSEKKTGDPNLKKWQHFFNFFIMANADILFLLTLRKPETQTLGGR